MNKCGILTTSPVQPTRAADEIPSAMMKAVDLSILTEEDTY